MKPSGSFVTPSASGAPKAWNQPGTLRNHLRQNRTPAREMSKQERKTEDAGSSKAVDPKTWRAPPMPTDMLQATTCDVSESKRARDILAEWGFCIIKGAAKPSEIEKAKELFVSWLRKAGITCKSGDWKSIDGSKWKSLGFPKTGVLTQYGIGQSDLLWYCRTLEGVRKAFQDVWETDDLITSFDGAGVARNPFYASEGQARQEWCTQGGWFHLDQNAKLTPGFDLWQGLLNLFPSSANTGSTVVVPKSHTDKFSKIFTDRHRINWRKKSHFVMLNRSGDFERYCKDAVQVVLDAGDLFLWDSRTIHCSQGINPLLCDPSEMTKAPEIDRKLLDPSNPFARLVTYICMVPRERLSEESKKARMRAVREGITGPHQPVLLGKHLRIPTRKDRRSNNTKFKYRPPASRSKAWELI
uniref:Uncharacterized protein n=1 Tax=Lotharella globosa TaxID=91324 RepID=A0A7S3Z9X9_9EUKA|mmetsp:Transcript_2868/g.5469  ORF Transcript_2868/g.5469 Transcript_2868/m.5469 type:complete len:413 (+) Transcript_2868:2-1240(+)